MRAFIIAMLGFYFVASCVRPLQAQEPAAPEQNPLEVFREWTGPTATEFEQLVALNAVEWAALNGNGIGEDGPEKARVSRQESKLKIKILYQSALKTVQKRPAAARLLTEYYVQWQATMDSIEPKLTESKFGYNVRMGEANRKVSEAWYRFETEWGE